MAAEPAVSPRIFSDAFLEEVSGLFRRLDPHLTDEDVMAALDSERCAEACESASQVNARSPRKSAAAVLLRAVRRARDEDSTSTAPEDQEH